MRWRVRGAATRAKERAGMSYFIFLMFFAVFAVIILTELLLLERPNAPTRHSRYNDELKIWESKIDSGSAESELPPPAQAPLDAVWQPVAGTRFRFFVYSAYLEVRSTTAIRIIAATKTRGADKVFCRLWLPDNRTITTSAKVQTIRENWNLKYSASFVLCLLRKTGVKPEETIGAAVAVIASIAPARPPTNLLTVLDTRPKEGIQENLHVCVKPFHFTYNRGDWLIEWMELNQMLGVKHFYMYNKTLSDSADCLLNQYRKEGLVTILPWKLPIVSVVEIRTEGQFAAFNDCLYRSMSTASWLLVIDVDEVVLPRKENDVLTLLRSLSEEHKPPAKTPTAFLFRNAFFYVKWEDDASAPVPLLTARKTRRWVTPHVAKNRSKYAVQPYDAVELGNHFLWEHAKGNSYGVAVDRALLHHYRENCEFGGEQCLTVPSTIDRTAHKWSKQLMEKVNERRELLAKACPGLAQSQSRTTGSKTVSTKASTETSNQSLVVLKKD